MTSNNIKDRVSKFPNRKNLTVIDEVTNGIGTSSITVDYVNSDNPTVEGTLIDNSVISDYIDDIVLFFMKKIIQLKVRDADKLNFNWFVNQSDKEYVKIYYPKQPLYAEVIMTDIPKLLIFDLANNGINSEMVFSAYDDIEMIGNGAEFVDYKVDLYFDQNKRYYFTSLDGRIDLIYPSTNPID